jgi:hypothetical protein
VLSKLVCSIIATVSSSLEAHVLLSLIDDPASYPCSMSRFCTSADRLGEVGADDYCRRQHSPCHHHLWTVPRPSSPFAKF